MGEASVCRFLLWGTLKPLLPSDLTITMKNTTGKFISTWRSIAVLVASAMGLLCGTAQAQQVLRLVPGQPPTDRLAIEALAVQPGDARYVSRISGSTMTTLRW